jgi:hypothetical protein
VSSAIGSSIGGQATGISTDFGGSGHWTASEGAVEGVAHPARHTAAAVAIHRLPNNLALDDDLARQVLHADLSDGIGCLLLLGCPLGLALA